MYYSVKLENHDDWHEYGFVGLWNLQGYYFVYNNIYLFNTIKIPVGSRQASGFAELKLHIRYMILRKKSLKKFENSSC